MKHYTVAIAFVMAVAIGLLLTASTTNANCLKRPVFVGMGYKLLHGNPDGGDNGLDPGLTFRNILQIDFDEGKTRKIRGNSICVPDQVNMIPLSSCTYKETAQIFVGTQTYQKKLSASVDGNVNGS